jgi:hypothetical protein
MKRTGEETQQYKTFEDLEVDQGAREFRKPMYGVAKRLPEAEKFALPGQIRRAAVSLTINIESGPTRVHETPSDYDRDNDDLEGPVLHRFNSSTL